MTAQLIDGKELARQIRESVKEDVLDLKSTGCIPTLSSVCVGEDPSTAVYLRQQERTCERLGIMYLATRMPASSSERAVRTMVESLNANPAVHGIIVQLPLPPGIDENVVREGMSPEKDVEGVHPANVGNLVYGRSALAPCTALAVLALIRAGGADMRGADVAVVGAGPIAGKPISLMLQSEMATTSVCHIDTKDVGAYTRQADIVVAAAGQPGLITGDMIRHGAVVIDVGINSVPDLDDQGRQKTDNKGRPATRVVGDVDLESVRPVAGHVTPVPGGVGPVTVAMLMRNIVKAARRSCEGTGLRGEA